MFANSFAVVLLGLLVGVPVLFFLVWGLKNNQFDNLAVNSLVIFDENDLRYARPWETDSQIKERVNTYGNLLPATGEGWQKWL